MVAVQNETKGKGGGECAFCPCVWLTDLSINVRRRLIFFFLKKKKRENSFSVFLPSCCLLLFAPFVAYFSFWSSRLLLLIVFPEIEKRVGNESLCKSAQFLSSTSFYLSGCHLSFQESKT